VIFQTWKVISLRNDSHYSSLECFIAWKGLSVGRATRDECASAQKMTAIGVIFHVKRRARPFRLLRQKDASVTERIPFLPDKSPLNSSNGLPEAFLFLAMGLSLLFRGQVQQGQLEGAREGDDGRAGVVGIHVLLDLGQPETMDESCLSMGFSPSQWRIFRRLFPWNEPEKEEAEIRGRPPQKEGEAGAGAAQGAEWPRTRREGAICSANKKRAARPMQLLTPAGSRRIDRGGERKSLRIEREEMKALVLVRVLRLLVRPPPMAEGERGEVLIMQKRRGRRRI